MSMLTTFGQRPTTPITIALSECVGTFAPVADVVTRDDVATVDVGDLTTLWHAHYFGSFGDLDRALMRDALAARPVPQAAVAVSVSHHNLHRLVEALANEVGSGPLGGTRVHERLLDLTTVVTRLRALLDEASGVTDTTT